jgi:rhomboid protease GluP
MGIRLTIGASGSIFGLLGAIVSYGRMRGGTFGSEIYRQTLQSAIVLFLFGFFMPGVNNWAHGGGFIGGYLAAMLVGHSEASTERPWLQGLSLATLAITVLSFALVIWRNLL